MDVIGIKPDEDSITFTANEWKHFIDEVAMRHGQEIEKCINNARYLAKLDLAYEQIKKGNVITKSLDELEAMA